MPVPASCSTFVYRAPADSISRIISNRERIRIPIIFMTGHGDIPMSVRAMKAGAVDFLSKPFRDQDMLDAVALRSRPTAPPRARIGDVGAAGRLLDR